MDGQHNATAEREMKERPILFSGPMVRALLDGSKTQTRRMLRDQDPIDLGASMHGVHLSRRPVHDRGNLVGHRLAPVHCPYGAPGDRLWVRETWARDDEDGQLVYRADVGQGGDADDWERNRRDGVPRFRWTPAIHMFRRYSRIALEVTRVRVERLQDISEADAIAEGLTPQINDTGAWGLADGSHYHGSDPRVSYWSLWDAINGAGSVEANPLAWVVHFRRIKP